MGQHNRVSNVRLVFKSDVFYKNTTKRQAKIHHSISFPKIAAHAPSATGRNVSAGIRRHAHPPVRKTAQYGISICTY